MGIELLKKTTSMIIFALAFIALHGNNTWQQKRLNCEEEVKKQTQELVFKTVISNFG